MLAQKGEHQAKTREVSSSILTGGDILLLEFLCQRLACKNPDCNYTFSSKLPIKEQKQTRLRAFINFERV